MSSFQSARLVRRNVRNTETGARGAVVRVSAEGVATVLLTGSGKLARMPATDLKTMRGAPIKFTMGMVRADIDELIVASDVFRYNAVRVMFVRQTLDERLASATKHANGLGYRADHAKRGSELAVKKEWTSEDHSTAKDCLLPYSGTQLWELASTFLTDIDGVEELHNASSDDSGPVDSFLLSPPLNVGGSLESEANALISEILASAGVASVRFDAIAENDPFAMELAAIQLCIA